LRAPIRIIHLAVMLHAHDRIDHRRTGLAMPVIDAVAPRAFAAVLHGAMDLAPDRIVLMP